MTESGAAVKGEIQEILRRYASDGLFSYAWWGYGTLDSPTPVFSVSLAPDQRQVFDLASLTKALVVTPLVFAEVSTGRLGLDDEVGAWLARLLRPNDPRLERLDPRILNLSVRSLLAHRSGLPAWRNFWIQCADVGGSAFLPASVGEAEERLIRALNRASADILPAQGQRYSDLGFLLLGLALTWTKGLDLSAQWQRFGADQLGIDLKSLPLQYAVATPNLADRAVPTAFCQLRGRTLTGEVHDENCAALGGLCGHAGIFGTGEGLSAYLYYLLQSSVGKELWKANLAARVLPPLPIGTPPNEGLCGWRQGGDPSSEPFGLGAAIGHMGFTGVAFWVRPDTRDYSVFLSNRVSSGRLRPGIAAARREVFAAAARLSPS